MARQPRRASYEPVEAIEIEENGDDVTTPRRRGGRFFNSPVTFASLAMIQAGLGVAAMAYFGACISTIEKRFQLKSSQSGIIVSTNDAVGLILLLFVTHYGKSRHRPRIIGALYVTVALGSLVHMIPHLIYGIPSTLGKDIQNKNPEAYELDFCAASNETEECNAKEVEESGSLLYQAGWLFVGQALASCLSCTYPLYITYLDDGVTKRALAVYMGKKTLLSFFVFLFLWLATMNYTLSVICCVFSLGDLLCKYIFKTAITVCKP